MDAGAEVRHEQEFRYASLLVLKRNNVARNTDRRPVQRRVGRRVVPEVAQLLKQIDRPRIVVTKSSAASPHLPSLLVGIPILRPELVPARLPKGRPAVLTSRLADSQEVDGRLACGQQGHGQEHDTKTSTDAPGNPPLMGRPCRRPRRSSG